MKKARVLLTTLPSAAAVAWRLLSGKPCRTTCCHVTARHAWYCLHSTHRRAAHPCISCCWPISGCLKVHLRSRLLGMQLTLASPAVAAVCCATSNVRSPAASSAARPAAAAARSILTPAMHSRLPCMATCITRSSCLLLLQLPLPLITSAVPPPHSRRCWWPLLHSAPA